VLVAPGAYFENINFHGKAITLTSSGGPSITKIDGGGLGPVVVFSSGETASSVLSGFTITHGAFGFAGGGISVVFSSPTISGNLITENTNAGCGCGIDVYNGSPIIQSNTITNNGPAPGWSGGDGAGIILAAAGPGTALVLSNIISNNSCTSGDGGGIYLVGGPALIENNLISGNLASGLESGSPDAAGGGIYALFADNVAIVQNLITNNTADIGAGVYSAGTPSSPIFVNNTIAGNQSTQNQGSALYLEAADSTTQLFNNLIIGESGQNALFCGSETPTFENNDVFSSNALDVLVGGDCVVPMGTLGNISSDPLFENPAAVDYSLMPGSFAIDAGQNSAPNLPATDFDGGPRIATGYIGDSPTVDIGAVEAQVALPRPSPTPTTAATPVAFALTAKPRSANFGVMAFGTIGQTSPSKTITVTNPRGAKREAITLESLHLSGDANGAYQITGGTCAPGLTLAPASNCTLDVAFTPTAAASSKGTLTIESNSSRVPQKTVELNGEGGLPLLDFSPTKLSFGKVPVGGPGVTLLVSMTNFFPIPVPLGNITIGGKDPGDFRLFNDCGSVLSPGSCTLSVTLDPTVKGKRKAILAVESTDLPITTNLTLIGIGD
jgi:hypothetical protein